MSEVTLGDLQESVLDKSAFKTLEQYKQVCSAYLSFVARTSPTRIVSPSHNNYVFYQYGEEHSHKITRPLNADLYVEDQEQFDSAFDRFVTFLADLKRHGEKIGRQSGTESYLASQEINRVVYTMQQALGSVADSFDNSNQARKRIGTLFETLIKIIIREVGLVCEPRTIKLPIPDHPGYAMPYELDLVFSRNKIILTAETKSGTLTEPAEEPNEPTPATKAAHVQADEIVGSVKTTSKDRIDKIFLDKYLLTKLLDRDIPVVAIFLHDVQRAQEGNNVFGIASTLKRNHFLLKIFSGFWRTIFGRCKLNVLCVWNSCFRCLCSAKHGLMRPPNTRRTASRIGLAFYRLLRARLRIGLRRSLDRGRFVRAGGADVVAPGPAY